MKNNLFLVFFLSITIFSKAQEQKTQVYICSSIHKAHTLNLNYTYENLFQYMDSINPDVIGVEIRNEDIDSSTTYLSGNYPFEMYEVIKKFRTKKIVGIDWLGSDIENKSIPKNYWKEISSVKKVQAKLNQDSLISNQLSILKPIIEMKNKLILNASIVVLNDGKYDAINEIYYQQMELILKETVYVEIIDFYRKRDEKIVENIINSVKNNKGKKLFFLVGADHRVFALQKLSEYFSDEIIVQPIQ